MFEWADNTEAFIDFKADSDKNTEKSWQMYRKIHSDLENISWNISDYAKVSPDAKIIGPVQISAGAQVLPNAHIEGPAYIGQDSIIGSYSLLRGGCFVGEKSAIGSHCDCTSVVVGSKTGIFHSNVISRSLVGNGCHITAFVVTGTSRPDRNPVVSEQEADGSENIHKRGSIICDSVYISPHVHITPNSRIEQNCAIGSFVRISRETQPGQFIKRKMEFESVENDFQDVSIPEPPDYPYESELL